MHYYTCQHIAGTRPYGPKPHCGAPTRLGEDGFPNSPYCDEHHAKCYYPVPPRTTAPAAREVDGRTFAP
jgi:hypothetical protein